MAEIIGIRVKANSVYRNGGVFTFPEEDEKALLRNLINYRKREEDRYHTVRFGDTIDSIAFQYYNQERLDSSKYWWVIADVNNIPFPIDISSYIGQELLIPAIYNVELDI